MSEWRAGVAEADITPPLGVDMTGYGNRPGPADHVLDRLAVRALVLQHGDEPPIALTGADLLGLGNEQISSIRGALAGDISAERLLLNHSHTHAGPTTAPLRAMGSPDWDYCRMVVRQTVSVVRAALRSMRPVHVSAGVSSTAIGLNRRELRAGKIVLGENPTGLFDSAVRVLRLDDAATGAPFACWLSHGTHPVVMGPSNTGISGEWPGVACRELARVLGCPVVFAQGCCGDVNPIRRGGYDQVVRVGRELAGSAWVAWERAEPVALGEGRALGAALETVGLTPRIPSVADAEAALALAEEKARALTESFGRPLSRDESLRRVESSAVPWAHDHLRVAQHGGAEPIPIDVQAIRLGDFTVAATGAETFVATGLALIARSKTRWTAPLGYSNGCFGYLPPRDEYPRGGYEVDGAYRYYGTLMVADDSEARVVEAGERVLAAAGSAV